MKVWVIEYSDGYNSQGFALCKTKEKAEELLEEFNKSNHPKDMYGEIYEQEVLE